MWWGKSGDLVLAIQPAWLRLTDKDSSVPPVTTASNQKIAVGFTYWVGEFYQLFAGIIQVRQFINFMVLFM